MDGDSFVMSQHFMTETYGTGNATKTDEFSEEFQRAFNPLPHFLRNCVANFFRIIDFFWIIVFN